MDTTPLLNVLDPAPPADTLDQPKPRHATHCPVEDWLSFLGHRWTALILWHLQQGQLKHATLMECLPGITAKVLSERLQRLQERGLVERSEHNGFPRGVSYQLTPRALDLVAILNQIETWSRSDEAPARTHAMA